MPSEPSPGWFRRHFNDDYKLIYRGRDQAQADQEAAFMARELKIEAGERVLDLCCGFGRHLSAFGSLGIDAVGLDLSRVLLAHAARSIRHKLVCADMRAIPFAGGTAGFQVIVNFFTSFGYFETDSENLEAAREIARALVPGGRFALDLMNAMPSIEALVPSSERIAGSFTIFESRKYDSRRRRIEKTIELRKESREPDGRDEIRSYFESVRVFTPHEIASLLTQAGLRVDRFLGDFQGSAYGPRSERMIVLGSKAEK